MNNIRMYIMKMRDAVQYHGGGLETLYETYAQQLPPTYAQMKKTYAEALSDRTIETYSDAIKHADIRTYQQALWPPAR